MRPITHAAHKRFVETEGWARLGTGRSKTGAGDHFRYTLTLANGETLFTRVSHGTGQIDDPNRVAAILRDQLQVSEADFWACAEDGELPPRPQSPKAPPREKLDYKLVKNLITEVGLSESDVASLSKQNAVQLWQDYLAGEPG